MMFPFFYFCRMYKTIFEVAQMDYPSEENLIRLKLGEISTIAHLSFGLPNRRLTIFHSEQIDKIEQLLIGNKSGCKENFNCKIRPDRFYREYRSENRTIVGIGNKFCLFYH